MPQNCDPTDFDTYPADHNPALDYTGLASTCPLWDVPLGDATTGAFATDLANGTLPAFAFVVPDGCDSSESCPVATGDAWLAGWLARIVSSSAFQSGTTAVFLAWDEGPKGSPGEDCLANLTDETCHVPLVVITPYTAAGTQSSTLFTHYSLLATTEQLLGLPLLGSAADPTTASLRPDFHL
jgi:phospholipase C